MGTFVKNVRVSILSHFVISAEQCEKDATLVYLTNGKLTCENTVGCSICGPWVPNDDDDED